MAKIKIAQQKPICLFCGERAGLTAEHLLPAWLGKDFPNAANAKRLDIVYRLSTNHAEPARRYSKLGLKNGMARNVRIKAVCRECNNTWMSRIEETAKPTLDHLMRGKTALIREADRQILRQWLSMKAMVWDGDDEEYAVVDRVDRANFMNNGTIPPGWRMWVGRSHVKAGINAPFLGKMYISCPEDEFHAKPYMQNYNTLQLSIVLGEVHLLLLASESVLVRTMKLNPRRAHFLREFHPEPGRDILWALMSITPLQEYELMLDWSRHLKRLPQKELSDFSQL